ncbi:TPA: hypothetical protein ACIS2J_000805, partial [Salmonella enterica subsp. enterica serovar Saintpaul]|uniref:hypothetical protein n=1 Tax=Salmonella enterica TaxID=28901 RepID=UPI001A9C3365
SISSSRNKISGIICFFYKLITPNEWDRRLVSGQDHFPLRVIFLHCQSEGGAQMRFCVHEWHG